MNMTAEGKIHTAFEAKQITDRFRKREFVLELDGGSRYPQTVLFQLTGDRCGELDAFQVGDEVRVEFSLRGREWTSPKGEVRYFNSLEVWGVERLGSGGASAADDFNQAGSTGNEPPPPTDDDDIPF